MEITEITTYINNGLPIWPWIGAAALCGCGIGHAIGIRKQITLKNLSIASPESLNTLATNTQVGYDSAPARLPQEGEMSVAMLLEVQKQKREMKEWDAKILKFQEEESHSKNSLAQQKKDAENKEVYYRELIAKQSAQITEQNALLVSKDAEIEDTQKKLRRFVTTTPIGNPLTTPVPTSLGNMTVANNMTVASNSPFSTSLSDLSDSTPTAFMTSAPTEGDSFPDVPHLDLPTHLPPLPIAMPSFDDLLQSARWNTSGTEIKSEPQNETKSEIQSDDLTAIPGIGPVIAKMLSNMGVRTYREIGLWTPERMKDIDARFEFQGRIEQEKWVENARRLHEKKYGPPALRI